jgi:Tfp pilus assembly protein PilX
VDQLSRVRHEQDGWAVVIAIVVTLAMLAAGMAMFAVVDQQHKESGNERQRESSLNLAEGLLYAQGFVLAGTWKSTAPGYSDCDSSQVGGPPTLCPDRNTLARFNSTSPALANFTSADFGTNVSWVTKVRDNGGALANAYQPAQADAAQSGTSFSTGLPYSCASPCNYDANGDKQLWVQARVVLNGHPRSIVARLQLERLTEGMPEQAVVAGHFDVSNNGNHNGTPILNGGDSTIQVRCTIGDPGCVSYSGNQVTPAPSPWPYGSSSLMTPAQLQRLLNTAKANNDYYAGCPTKGGPVTNGVPKYSDNKYHLEGQVVWVDNCPNPPQLGNDVYTVDCPPTLPAGLSSKCINTPSQPGLLIWHKGVADLSGAYTYVGLIYNVNDSDESPPTAASSDVVITDGGFGVWGAIAVDGNGGLEAGSNGLQLMWNQSAFDAIQSYGTAGLVQNTWRELNPNE